MSPVILRIGLEPANWTLAASISSAPLALSSKHMPVCPASAATAAIFAALESSRTTKLYDCSQGEITLDEIERIPAV
jgi:hypothetical protein